MKFSTRDFRFGDLSLLGAGLLLTTGLASASPLLGTFGFDSPGVLAFSTSAVNNYIQFCATVSGTTCSSAGTGGLTVTGAGTLSFAGLGATTTGTIDDLTNCTASCLPGYTFLPTNPPGGVTVDNIMSLTGGPGTPNTWDFQADSLPLASCTTTTTQACIGAFQLGYNAPNTSVEINILGILCNGTCIPANESALDIGITGTFAGLNIAQVESGAGSLGGIFSDNLSATVIATAIPGVPEPGTSAMVLTGVGFLLLARKQRGRRS